MLELLNIDLLRIGPAGPISRAALHQDLYPALARRQGDKRFLFVQNWILPPYQAVIVGALDPNAAWLTADTPQARVWSRFLAMSADEQKAAFKIMLSVEEGPWLVRRAVPKKPIVVGRQLKMSTHHAVGDHFEVVADVTSGKTEQVARGIVLRALRNVHLAMAAMIEGVHQDELPEALLCCAGLNKVNVARLCCPSASVDS